MENNIIILAFSHKQGKKCCPYQINFQNKLRVYVGVFHSIHCATRKVFLRIPGKNCDVTLTALNLHTDVCEKLLEKKTCACKIDHLQSCKGNINIIHTVVLATIQIVTSFHSAQSLSYSVYKFYTFQLSETSPQNEPFFPSLMFKGRSDSNRSVFYLHSAHPLLVRMCKHQGAELLHGNIRTLH